MNSKDKPTATRALKITLLSDVTAKPINWLWYGYIRRGAINLIMGRAGIGKSLLTLDIAACVTTGASWPIYYDKKLSSDGKTLEFTSLLKPNMRCAPKGSVILLSGEDGLADEIKPRLDAAGGDPTKIRVIESVHTVEKGKRRKKLFSMKADLDLLACAIKEDPETKVVIIDPWGAFTGGIDIHRYNDVYDIMSPFSKIAEQYNIAAIIVGHLNKSVQTVALDRAIGSVAFGAAARSVFIVARDPDDEETGRVFLPAKSNSGRPQPGLKFTVDSELAITGKGSDEIPMIKWTGLSDVSADEALGEEDTPSESRSAMDDAKEWLEEYLGALTKPVHTKEGQNAAGIAGQAWGTVKKAMQKLKKDNKYYSFQSTPEHREKWGIGRGTHWWKEQI